MISFKDKVAVVTGGAAGIGAATVRKFAELGAAVVVADVDAAAATALITALKGDGLEASFAQTDVLVEEDIKAAIEHAVSAYGGLDILHNNAGIPRTQAPDAEVTDMTAQMWRKTLDGHLTSVMLGCKYAIPHMRRRGGGAIVNTSSGGALAATVDLTAYSAAKAGVHALTREVAVAYGRDNIRCNAVVPGAVLTARGRATLPPEILQLFADETPLPYLAEPEDIADIAVYLASDRARMITGQAILADGGMLSKLPYWSWKLRAVRGEEFDLSAARY
ncbi:MAG: SDR family NAD(P)-dependent oxidoreductase [Sphingobium sp.]|uniref:SDR family NAD(P)-dependent oxidoreductase n=1 Tax=Sphingobium sp. TaxID=1912891 RepID=UPI0029AAF285|nr:SDR family NAD(P)-dependent oxidoreductase [Sphingobium sp.]MDX3908577.1 SDR family NAD(P)-dependent oxidoreductase [Sphingobium sp.]